MRNRSTADLLILLVAGTVCFSVLASGATVGIIKIVHPDLDTSGTEKGITDIINTLIGLLAGFIAGRTQTKQEEKPDGPPGPTGQ